MMLWINIKRFNHLQAIFSFDTVLLHASSVMFMVASEIDRHISALNPLVQKFLLHQSHWFGYLSIVIKIWHIIFISFKQIKYVLQPFHFYGWWTVIAKAKANLMQLKRIYCCFSRSQPTQEIFLSFPLFFVCFYFRFFWPTETTERSLKCLIHFPFSKSMSQVILCNEHRNHLFWA